MARDDAMLARVMSKWRIQERATPPWRVQVRDKILLARASAWDFPRARCSAWDFLPGV